MKRFFDIVFAIVLLVILLIPMILIATAVKASSVGNILYWSDRVGRDNIVFKMPKFRSMLTDTPAVATHLLDNPDAYLSPIGGFLRSTSLDELPQLFSVLKGDMSFVGPRPALYNQDDLITLRAEKGVDKLLPGITGWAQVNGRNAISWKKKFEYDVWYVDNLCFKTDMLIYYKTFLKVIKSDGINQVGVENAVAFNGDENE